MSRIKIDVPGYESFDGHLGTLRFEGGVSVRSATVQEIARIGANVKIVKVDTDEQIGPATDMVNTRHVSAVVEVALKTEQQEQTDSDTTGDKYTEDQLIKIGEDGGIKAMRKIANEYDIKGVSIDIMIKDILEAQKKAA